MMHGGDRIARVLAGHGVKTLFTLTGGHISPILTGAKAAGIDVVDTRHEAAAVFAADATSRLTGVPGVAAVTAGPGVTNTLTALQNAMLAQSPVVVFGGAAATALKGRGALQDIDQQSVVRPHVKEVFRARRVRDLAPLAAEAFRVSNSEVPGPVFVEVPIDLLYDEETVRSLYLSQKAPKSLSGRVTQRYLAWHVNRLFSDVDAEFLSKEATIPDPPRIQVERAAKVIAGAQRPVLIVGSGAMAIPQEAEKVAGAVEALAIPTYLASMARGLLGVRHPLHLRHRRRAALREADVVVLAGMPMDFRLDYGRAIAGSAKIVSVGRDREALSKNRHPAVEVPGDAGRFLQRVAGLVEGGRWDSWLATLRARDDDRDAEIAEQATEPVDPVNPLHLLQRIDAAMADDSVIVADGGDFVASASYVVWPRGPLRWLDPGVFGTLGVGGGFAAAASLARGGAEVWLLYGDGAAGFSLTEFDTFARHGLGVIAVIGNDAGWTQIARDQVAILGDDVGTVLAASDYHKVAEAFGGVGLLLDDPDRIDAVLVEAKQAAATGRPVLINARIGVTDFRKGSISM